MGIPKLTSFVDKQFSGWRRGPVQGELIIDGFSLCHALFGEYAPEHNPVYGGDYISFSICIQNFFNTLVRCNIVPFVIFDGTDIDMKKRKTPDKRRLQQAESVVKLLQAPAANISDNLIPYLSRDVMIEAVRESVGNERFYVADSDADIDIASFGITKKCPILSADSDFYIFPLPSGYIPYSKFYWHNTENNKIFGEFYFCEQFAKQFGISDIQLLALLPAFIGNDIISPIDEYMKRILPQNNAPVPEKVLQYAADFKTIDECKAVLLQQKLINSHVPLQNIQTALQDYFTAVQKPYGGLNTVLSCNNDTKLPDFVLENIRRGVYPKLIIDALCRREVDLKVAIEDMPSEKWCHLIGIPVRKVIYGILCGSSVSVREHQRHERSYVTFEIKVVRSAASVAYHGNAIPLPSLSCCSTEVHSAKKILYGVLECREKDFKSFAKNYRVVLAVTRYWYNKCIDVDKNALLHSFLLFLQQPKTVVALKMSPPSRQASFPLSSFTHAFAQWQSLYYDIHCLNQLLRQPLPLLEPAEFLECSNLYGYTKAVMENGVTEVIHWLELDMDAYVAFLKAVCPFGEKKKSSSPLRDDVHASKNRFEFLSID